MNPFAEVWVGRTKAECLNHFIVFGEIHLRHILKSWLDCYHKLRSDQGIGSVPIDTPLPSPAPIEDFRLEDVVCHEALGGLPKHCELRAA
jgi:putative transposase